MNSPKLFLSYHNADCDLAQRIARALAARKVSVDLDVPFTGAATPWPQALSEQLGQARAVAVLLGSQGLSQRQKQAIGLALKRQAELATEGQLWALVPVLLPGADLAAAFLFQNHWIDLRSEAVQAQQLDVLAQAAVSQAPRRPVAVVADHCPYRGFRSFREEDAAFFYGRERFVERLLTAVTTQPFTALAGPAGSGKSSVIQAGLLPRLRRQIGPDGWWEIITVEPSGHPCEQLAARLSHLIGPANASAQQLAQDKLGLAEALEQAWAVYSEAAPRLLIVIDPFESLLRLTPVAERKAFIEGLRLALERCTFLSLLIGLRSEWAGHVANLDKGLATRLEQGNLLLPRLGPDEVRQAITQPARLVTVACEPALVEEIVGDVSHDESGNLSLLSFGLQELWRQHEGGLLSCANYKKMGGLTGAIEPRAEAIFGDLTANQQALAARVFRDLVSFDETGRASLRSVSLADLVPGDQIAEVKRVLSPFEAPGLVEVQPDEISGQKSVALASEQLLHRWERLREWLADEREFLRWRRRLRSTLIDGEQVAASQPLLTQAKAERWLKTRPESLSPTEREYIEQGLTRRRQQRWRRWAIGGVTAFALVATIAFIIWLQNRAINRVAWQRDVVLTARAEADRARQIAESSQATAEALRDKAEQARQLALARQLAVQAQALLDDQKTDLTLGTLLAVEAQRRGPSLASMQSLRQSLTQLPRPTARLAHRDEVQATLFSPDGHWLATRSGQTIGLWNVDTGAMVAELSHDGVVSDAVFSPDGRWLVTTSLAHQARIWEVATAREVGRLRHRDTVHSVVFSSDGRWLAARGERMAYVWPLTTNAADNMLLLRPKPTPLNRRVDLALKRLNKGEPPKEIQSAVIGQGYVQMRHETPITTLALSPDGRWLVTAGIDGVVRVWQVITGQEVTQLRHGGAVRTVAFSPDGRLLVSGGEDRAVRVWSLEPDDVPTSSGTAAAHTLTVQAGVTLPHPSRVRQATFSPGTARDTGGYWLVTIAEDDTARVWAISDRSQQASLAAKVMAEIEHQDEVVAVAFSPDDPPGSGGRWLATASADGTARIWLTATGRQLARMAHTAPVNDVAFSPNGRRLATTSRRTAQLWQTTIGYEVAQVAYPDTALFVDFVPQRDPAAEPWLATLSGRMVHVWEATTAEDITRLEHDRYVNAMALRPGNQKASDQPNDQEPWLALSSSRTVKIWAVKGGHEPVQMTHSGVVRELAFSPDGHWLAGAGLDKIVRLWDAVTGQELALMSHDDWVNAIAFSPNGHWLATASDDKTVRIWEVPSGHEVTRIPHHGVVRDVAFSPDSQWLATASSDHTVRLFVATTVREVAHILHRQAVAEIAFSPDGRWLATRSGRLVRTWAVPGGEAVAQMEHDGAVAAMAYSPDSRALATASGDRMARVWAVTTGQEVARLPHEYRVNSVAFSPTGRWLATASEDHLAQVWFLQPEDILAELCRRLPRNLTPEEWQQYLGDERYRPTCGNLPASMLE